MSSDRQADGAARDGSRVAVVLLNYCGEEDTAACIASLREPGRADVSVILVDNGSPDGSGERLHLRFPELDYVQTGANLGYSGGNNVGITRALETGCDYVLVLNNDTVVEAGAIDRLVETAAAGKRIGAVGPRIAYAEDPSRAWFAGGELDRVRAVGRHLPESPRTGASGTEPLEVTFLTGCCLLLPARALREVGAFAEEYFMYLEDAELSIRLVTAGFRLIYEPRARILHRIPLASGSPAPYQIEHRDRNRRRLVRRHFGPLERATFAGFFYPTRIAHGVRYLASGDLPRARAIWRGMTTSLSGS